MRRKPIDIMADVINTLNGLQVNHAYNINEIKKRSHIHWETALHYVHLIQFIQEFAPKLAVNLEEKNIQLLGHSHQFKRFTLEQQLIIYLYLEKAFSKATSIQEKDLWSSFPQNKIDTLLHSQFLEITTNEEKRYYLTTPGKFKAQGLLATINRHMAHFMEFGSDMNGWKENDFVIAPFKEKQDLIDIRRERIDNECMEYTSPMQNYLMKFKNIKSQTDDRWDHYDSSEKAKENLSHLSTSATSA